ncbi:MAG: exodeoxyribonuclease VII small subunit [Lachnospiraceae bacterium]|nr:exodeoxyribonuclease VII small subunit [Lachnospiraceae bacterium]
MPKSKKSSENEETEIEALSIEESFEYLEKAVDMLENGSLSLEESFKVYQAAMKVVKNCGNQIDETEKKVMLISGEGEEMEALDEEF